MDWIEFFKSRNIHYATFGPNVARGNCCIKCPWCGNSDEGEHLSINLAGKGFRCWRQPVHAGKNPVKLIQALLNCSWEQASQLAGQQIRTLPNDFMSKVRASLNGQEVIQKSSYLKLPVEFKKFSELPSCRPYLNYIQSRGFSIADTRKYDDVRYASQGLYKGRVIFPIWHHAELVGWTGRTIYSSEQLRYKTLTHDVEKARENGEIPAPSPISHSLLFYNQISITDADTIVLCEGPFDAWKVNVLGESLGVVATCFFTSTLSKQQLNLLHEILPRYKNRFLLLDQNTFSKSSRIRADLIALDAIVKRLPPHISDPGEIKNTKQLKEMLAIV